MSEIFKRMRFIVKCNRSKFIFVSAFCRFFGIRIRLISHHLTVYSNSFGVHRSWFSSELFVLPLLLCFLLLISFVSNICATFFVNTLESLLVINHTKQYMFTLGSNNFYQAQIQFYFKFEGKIALFPISPANLPPTLGSGA